MNFVQKLKNFKKLKYIMEADLEEVKRLKDMVESTQAINTSREAIKGGPLVNRTEELVVRILDLEAVLLDEVEELAGMQEELAAGLRKLPDPAHRAALTYLYLDGMTAEAAADKMGYSLRQFYRLKGKAIKHVSMWH